MGIRPTVNPAALHLLGNLQRDAPLAHVHKGYHHHHDDEHHGDDQQVHPAAAGAANAGIGEAGNDAVEQVAQDTGHNQHADAVTHAFFADALANPHGQGGTASHADAHQHIVEPAGLDVAQAGHQADGLHRGQADGDIAGNARDLLTAAAFLVPLHTLQGGNGDGQQLHNNAGVDVGCDTHGHDGHVGEVGTGHHVDQLQDRQIRSGTRQHPCRVHAGSGNNAHQAEQDQHTQGVEDLIAQLRDLPHLSDAFPHVRSPRLSRREPQSSPLRRR